MGNYRSGFVESELLEGVRVWVGIVGGVNLCRGRDSG